ncbi:MAG: tRNA (guanosine(46)-N7)-methyltransferase TrmB [Verrucomicrobiales bacterium]|nr:tRNA (guanosine(46)-N7)-methyltransferase TrmB [Verrucomicrobiales bacterium]
MASKRKNDPFPYPNEIFPENWFARLEAGDLFADDRPVEIDLGCGDGGFLLEMAARFPDRNFLGIERLLGRVRKIWRGAETRGLKNVKVLRVDTNYAVEWLLPQDFAARIHFLFPDPWPKKKHASRRQMCREPFLRHLHRLLKPGDGELIFKTDHRPYFDEAKEVLASGKIDCFEEIPWDADGLDFYPETDFEQQWLAEGKEINGIRLRVV